MNADLPEIFGPVSLEEPALWQRWWFWCAVAAILVLVALAAYLIGRSAGRRPAPGPGELAFSRLNAIRAQLAAGRMEAVKALSALMRDAIHARTGLDVSPMTPGQMEGALGAIPAIAVVRRCEEALCSGAEPEAALGDEADTALRALFAPAPGDGKARG